MKEAHALDLAAMGFPVFQIEAGKKAPPLLAGWPQRATTDPEIIKAWWTATPNANVGVSAAGLVVIDCDSKKGGDEKLNHLRLLEDIPETLTTLTPNGKHFFYRLPAGHPGVPNSVEALGKGLDIRSTGGYCLGVGSEVPAGRYEFEDPAIPIADAPQWLIEKLGQAVPKAAPAAIVPDAPGSMLERAREWLTKQPGAIEGQGGDAHTFKVACGLRDMAVSESQAFELLQEWNDRCSPPWAGDELGVKVANAYRYAENAPGSRAALPSDFPMIEPVHDRAPTPEGKFPRVKRLSEVTIHSGNGNFVDGLCNAGELFQVIGAPGGRKSQAMGWLAFCVATEQPWLNIATAYGSVLYIAAEREAEQAKRLVVWACDAKRDPDTLPLRIMGPGSSLAKSDFTTYVAEQAHALHAETGKECRLIVIDTTMASLAGEDLNTTATATLFGQHLKVIAGKVRTAAIGAIHHTPKSGAETGMGSQGFDATFDATLVIEETTDGGSVRQIKGNTTRDWIAKFEWKGEQVQAERNGQTFLAWKPVRAATVGGSLERLKGNAKRGLAALCKLRPDNAPVDPADWQEACREFLGDKNVRQRFYDLKKVLLDTGYVKADEQGFITRRCE